MKRNKALAISAIALLALMVATVLSLPYKTAAQSPVLVRNFQTSAIISAANNGYNISNITLINPFSFTLNGSFFNVHISYINHNSTGLVLNNSVYALYLNNNSVSIRNTTTHDFYAKLMNVSYYSKQQSVAILFYSTNRPPQPILNNTYRLKVGVPITINVSSKISVSIESNQSTIVNLDVANVTNATVAPEGYTPLLMLNVSAISLPPMPLTVSLKTSYNCTLDPSRVVPLKRLANGTWIGISKLAINASACTILFSIPSDPVIGLFYSNMTSTSSSASTAATTTALTTIPVAAKGGLGAAGYVAIIIIILIVLVALYFASKGKRQGKNANQGPKAK